ncbi:hypothetical protein [Nocardioides humi]|uniref:hypothetical protein n=1 Tax=Nocardioides humi TaxID=449461 RepID=UPI001129ADEE|nr:hypothetical protein [Nocardioides humi]
MTGLVVGIVVTVAAVAFLAFAVVMGSRTVWERDAEVGQCIDIDFLDDPIKASCAEPHAGEVIWVGRFDSALADRFDDVSRAEFCAGLPGLEATYRSAIESGDYFVRVESDSLDESEPKRGDDFFCHLERRDGKKLVGRIGDDLGTEGA